MPNIADLIRRSLSSIWQPYVWTKHFFWIDQSFMDSVVFDSPSANEASRNAGGVNDQQDTNPLHSHSYGIFMTMLAAKKHK